MPKFVSFVENGQNNSVCSRVTSSRLGLFADNSKDKSQAAQKTASKNSTQPISEQQQRKQHAKQVLAPKARLSTRASSLRRASQNDVTALISYNVIKSEALGWESLAGAY